LTKYFGDFFLKKVHLHQSKLCHTGYKPQI